jgi:hypothetical protein
MSLPAVRAAAAKLKKAEADKLAVEEAAKKAEEEAALKAKREDEAKRKAAETRALASVGKAKKDNDAAKAPALARPAAAAGGVPLAASGTSTSVPAKTAVAPSERDLFSATFADDDEALLFDAATAALAASTADFYGDAPSSAAGAADDGGDFYSAPPAADAVNATEAANSAAGSPAPSSASGELAERPRLRSVGSVLKAFRAASADDLDALTAELSLDAAKTRHAPRSRSADDTLASTAADVDNFGEDGGDSEIDMDDLLADD